MGEIVPVCFSREQVHWADGWLVYINDYPAVRPEHPDDQTLLASVAVDGVEPSTRRPVYAVLIPASDAPAT